MDTTLVLLTAPLLIGELVLKIVALVSLYHRPADQVRGPKAAWAAAIVLLSIIGWAGYFIFGRNEK
ncbi:MAG: PLDc_N domain-containing protein [Deltaproteobacteria bacterium]|nr:PLDc_N domain-containing protein [Deltaproteobacteria bacterium]